MSANAAARLLISLLVVAAVVSSSRRRRTRRCIGWVSFALFIVAVARLLRAGGEARALLEFSTERRKLPMRLGARPDQ